MSKYPIQHHALPTSRSAVGAANTAVANPLDQIRKTLAREHHVSRAKNYGGTNPDPASKGMHSLDRLASAIQPGAHVPRTSAIKDAFGKFFTGGLPPMPDTQMAPFKRSFMPGKSDVPVSMHKLGSKTKPNSNVNIVAHLKNEAYGPAAYDEGKLRLLLPIGSPAWVSKRYPARIADRIRKDQVEVQCVATFNRAALVNARGHNPNRTGLMSYAEFCSIWAEQGVVNEAASATTTSYPGGMPSSAISLCMNGPKEIPNLWLEWPKRLQLHDHLWLIYVARTEGYEDIERKFMIEGNPEGFRKYFEEEELKRSIAEPYRRRQIAQVHAAKIKQANDVINGMPGGSDILRADVQMLSPAMALSGDPEIEHSMLVAQHTRPSLSRRYSRWETFVTQDGCPPPQYVLRSVDPQTGEVHKGGCRPMGVIMKDHPSFDAHMKWENSTRMLLYSDPERMGSTSGSLTQTNPIFNNHPMVMTNLYSRAVL